MALRPMPEVYASFVGMLAVKERFAEEASHCEDLLALAPDDAVHRLVAAVYARLGREAEATALRDHSVALDRRASAAEIARARRPTAY